MGRRHVPLPRVQGDFGSLARGLESAKAPSEQQNGRSSAREELYGALVLSQTHDSHV